MPDRVQVENYATLGRSAAHEVALDCLVAGIDAAHPRRVVRETVGVSDGVLTVTDVGGASETVALDDFEQVVVVGGGNAAAGVASALEDLLGDRLDGGVVVTDDPAPTARVDVVAGDHPIPSDRGRDGARRVVERADAADANTLVIAVVTGGASALLPAPAAGVSLTDLQRVTTALVESGASIDEINAVRKHCSALKGGRLARTAAPARVVTLVFSDVVGDDPSVVGSGPTAPDPTTFADALDALVAHDVDAPGAVREHLEAGAAGRRKETPGPDDPAFDRVTHHVLASNRTALDAAAETAATQGYDPLILSSRVRGEAREAAKTHVAVVEEAQETETPVAPPAVVLSGGETTVTVTGDGDGGPNQEFALSAGVELAGRSGVVLASVDTDGRDGATDAAGGLVDGETVTDRVAARAALAAHDAYPFLDERDGLVLTGETGTNVNDLRVAVVTRPDGEE